MTPAIFGLSGPILTDEERGFFREVEPAGYILFRRNIVDRAQLLALTDSLRALSGNERLAILIDQEGGPVARMRPPEWPAFPAGPRFDALYEVAPMSAIKAAEHNAHAIALMLREVGVTVDCLPLLDVARPDSHSLIADRALGSEPMRVAALGRAVLDGLARGGVVGVVKHMPGHGRALVDSHHELPRVTADAEALEEDLRPFRALNREAMGMTAHVVYEAWDAERPGTLSPVVVRDVIRGRIGFDGLLMTDDIDMKALTGTAGEKGAAALAAGVDLVLDCWARMPDMADIAAACPAITPAARERLDRATADVGAAIEPAEIAWLMAERDKLLAVA